MELDAASQNALENYQYRTDCRSVMYPSLKRFWYQPVLNLFPYWHANIYTLLAFFCSCFAFISCLLFVVYPSAPWLLALAGALFWGYNTLDNIDGVQARRTGTSGPIGEIFDHGLDAVSVFYLPLGIAYALGVSSDVVLILVSVVSLACWTTMWELYYSGEMVTGALSDVEGVVFSSLFLVAGGILGAQVVNAGLFGSSISFTDLMVFLALGGAAVQIVMPIWRVKKLHLQIQFLVPLLVQLALIGTYYFTGKKVPVLPLAILMGICASFGTVFCILDRLYKRPIKMIEPISVVMAVLTCAAIGLEPHLQGHLTTVLWGLIGLSMLLYYITMHRNIAAISRFLGIHVFTLTPEQKEQLKEVLKKG